MRHQIMVAVNEMDRMDYPYRHNALGRIYKSAPTILWDTFSTAPCKSAPTAHGILFLWGQ